MRVNPHWSLYILYPEPVHFPLPTIHVALALLRTCLLPTSSLVLQSTVALSLLFRAAYDE